MDTFKTNIYFSNEITFPMSLFYYNYTIEAETFCHTTNNARPSGSKIFNEILSTKHSVALRTKYAAPQFPEAVNKKDD